MRTEAKQRFAHLIHIRPINPHAIVRLYSFLSKVDCRKGPVYISVINGYKNGIFLKYVELEPYVTLDNVD